MKFHLQRILSPFLLLFLVIAGVSHGGVADCLEDCVGSPETSRCCEEMDCCLGQAAAHGSDHSGESAGSSHGGVCIKGRLPAVVGSKGSFAHPITFSGPAPGKAVFMHDLAGVATPPVMGIPPVAKHGAPLFLRNCSFLI